jgi:hypothetical protein
VVAGIGSWIFSTGHSLDAVHNRSRTSPALARTRTHARTPHPSYSPSRSTRATHSFVSPILPFSPPTPFPSPLPSSILYPLSPSSIPTLPRHHITIITTYIYPYLFLHFYVSHHIIYSLTPRTLCITSTVDIISLYPSLPYPTTRNSIIPPPSVHLQPCHHYPFAIRHTSFRSCYGTLQSLIQTSLAET